MRRDPIITSDNNVLEAIRGCLIASCQPVVDGPMDSPDIVARQALAAEQGGAGGLRVEGIERVKGVAERCQLPLIGITKRDLSDSEVRITPTVEDAERLVRAGANIVAYDATDRHRPCPTSSIVQAIRATGALAMADCASVEDGKRALAEGAEIVASTLAGYTGPASPEHAPPDLQLVEQLAELGAFVIAEGRIQAPFQAAQAISAGADAVVVGSAITRIEHITSWYVAAIQGERSSNPPSTA